MVLGNLPYGRCCSHLEIGTIVPLSDHMRRILSPLGLDSGRTITPLRKNSYWKEKDNPNQSSWKKIWFGLSCIGAGSGTRTRTGVNPRDFKSLASTDSTMPAESISILIYRLWDVKGIPHKRYSRNRPAVTGLSGYFSDSNASIRPLSPYFSARFTRLMVALLAPVCSTISV